MEHKKSKQPTNGPYPESDVSILHPLILII